MPVPMSGHVADQLDDDECESERVADDQLTALRSEGGARANQQ